MKRENTSTSYNTIKFLVSILLSSKLKKRCSSNMYIFYRFHFFLWIYFTIEYLPVFNSLLAFSLIKYRYKQIWSLINDDLIIERTSRFFVLSNYYDW